MIWVIFTIYYFYIDIPPSSTEGAWKQAKKSDQGSVLVVSHEPCTTTNDEL